MRNRQDLSKRLAAAEGVAALRGMAVPVFLAAIMILALPAFAAAATDAPAHGASAKSVIPDNGIPVIVINVDESDARGEGYGTIEQMNKSQDHSVRCTGSVQIITNGYQGGFGETPYEAPAEDLALDYIRGRGNSTWLADKKPYKIKFSKKQDLFGMGADKEWALLANYYDGTQIRNRITSWLGQEMDIPATPQGIPVDLVMTGEKFGSKYLGSYCLYETVKVSKTRLAIDELSKDTESLEGEENITGGYLLSWYTAQNEDEPQSTIFSTTGGLNLINKTPSYEDEETLTAGQRAQRSYIRDYIQEVEDLIMADGQIDGDRHEEIAARLDLKSAADYWLIQEFSLNSDAFVTSSTYLYKERNGRLAFGPLWDFDLAWSSHGGSQADDETACSGFNYTQMDWIDHLRNYDPEFVRLLQERWTLMEEKLQEMTEDGGLIDSFREEIRASQQADQKINGENNDNFSGDFDAEIEALKGFIDGRRAWFSEHLDDIDNVYATITYRVDGETLGIKKDARIGWDAELSMEAPDKEGLVFTGWRPEGMDQPVDSVDVTGDIIVDAVYIPEDQAVLPASLRLGSGEGWAGLNQSTFLLGDIAVIKPDNVTNKRISWTSSDESIATVEKDGTVSPEAAGDVVITGTMHNGVSGSLLLHVFDPSAADPLQVQAKPVKLKASALRAHKKTIKRARALKVTSAVGGVEYKLTGVRKAKYKKKFRVNKKTGKITVKKGLPRGTYRLTIQVKANQVLTYIEVSKTATVRVRVR